MRHFFSLNRFTFSGAVYLPSSSSLLSSSSSTPIFGRFIPRTLLGAEYFDYSSSEIFVRTLIDLDPFKAAKEMKKTFKTKL